MAALIQWLVWRSMTLQKNESDLFDAGFLSMVNEYTNQAKSGSSKNMLAN